VDGAQEAFVTTEEPSPAKRSPGTILLGVAVVVLLGQTLYLQGTVRSLRGELAKVQQDMEARAQKVALERLQGRRAELAAATQWLQEFYASEEGLRRPNGLWDAKSQRLDAEGIGTWILDVYLNARIAGASDAEARQRIMDAVRGSDEWRRVHTQK
jgi:hypothetical protein